MLSIAARTIVRRLAALACLAASGCIAPVDDFAPEDEGAAVAELAASSGDDRLEPRPDDLDDPAIDYPDVDEPGEGHFEPVGAPTTGEAEREDPEPDPWTPKTQGSAD